MRIQHVGIRPEYPLIKFTEGRKALGGYKYEIFPDGGHKLWSHRMLTSGCDEVIERWQVYRGLIYCPTCDEWFSVNQFKEYTEEV